MRLRFWSQTSGPGDEVTLENPAVELVKALLALDDDNASTGAGVAVTPDRAMRHPAVSACIRVISESIAALPFRAMVPEGRGRTIARDDPRDAMLNVAPNPEMTAMELWEGAIGSCNLRGPAYLYRPVTGTGGTDSIWPLRADWTRPARGPDGLRYFVTRLPDGQEVTLRDDEVIYVRGFSIGGIPLSPISAAREDIATAIAAVLYTGRMYRNNGRPGGVIEVPGRLNDNQWEEANTRWKAGHQAISRAGLVSIIDNGATWRDVNVNPVDMQLLEARKYDAVTIARWYRVPPYKIAHLEPGSVAYASVEQQAIDFVVDCLRSWIVRLEQAVRRTMFSGPIDRRTGAYPGIVIDGLLRGDTKSRYEAYAIGRQWGWLSVNDIREKEDQPEVDGGDIYLQPLNMVPAGATTIPPQATIQYAPHGGAGDPRRNGHNGHGQLELMLDLPDLLA